jgi:hypothetical protein
MKDKCEYSYQCIVLLSISHDLCILGFQLPDSTSFKYDEDRLSTENTSK